MAFSLLIITMPGCKKWLDINSDPDTTQQPSNSSVLPPLLAAIPTALQSDGGLYIAKYTQNWLTHTASNNNVYDIQGFTFSGGTMAGTWNLVYFAFGKNLQYMIENSQKLKQNDFIGVGLALKAWVYQHGTDYHSDMPFYSSFNPDSFAFKYESQNVIYKVVDSMCRDALVYLNAANGDPTNTLTRGDMVYNGDIGKWKRFVYGVLARNYNHISNKTGLYQPDSVIKYCDSSLTVVADDFCVPFDATVNNNSNYFGTYRDNMPAMRQSNFIVKLLDGTTLAGSSVPANRDPRIAHMLSASHDTTNGNGGYRGVDPGQGDPYAALNPPASYLLPNGQLPTGSALTNYNNARKKVGIAFGDSLYLNPSAGNFTSTGKYLFKNKAVFPVMTSAEIQFTKAEAAFRKGDVATAYDAYKKGINLHFDFINRDYSPVRGSWSIYNTNPIQLSQRIAYMAGNNVRQSAVTLTMSDIMLQKYIALWAWGFFETWVDMRRFGMYDLTDPVTLQPFLSVYKNLSPLTSIDSRNEQKYAQKVRPHYTSEWTYNRAELDRLGILKNNWHVTKMWFTEPQ